MAQTPGDDEIELKPISVVSTRIDENIKLTPANITIITAEQIEKSPARNLPDLLSLEAGVLSRSLFGNSAVRSTVDIRGFGASGTQNTLILVDGRRLNDIDLSSINYAAIPIHNIERIEITRGAGGVLYGDGAVGGAINIVTKRAQADTMKGSVSAGYGSYNTRQGEASVQWANQDYAINIAANYLESDGYRDNNDLRQKNIQADIRRYIGVTEVYLKAGASDQDLRLPGVRTVDPSMGLDELRSDRRGTGTPNDFADEDSQFVTAGIRQPVLNGNGEAILDIGYRQKNQQAFFDDLVGFPPFFPPGTFANFLDTDLNTWSITPRIQATTGAHEWIVGLDYYHYEYDSERSLNPLTANTPSHILDNTQKSFALYGNNRITVTDNTFLELGARVQRVTLDTNDTFDPTAPASPFVAPAAAPLNRSDTEPMLNIGIRHFLTHDFSIFGRFGRSARYATVDELFQANPITFVQEFSVIDPQTAKHFDLGVDYTISGLSASLTGYYMDLENEIHFNSAIFANENLDPTERAGIEAAVKWDILDTLSASVNYAYLRSKFSEGAFRGNDVPLVPRHTGNIGLIWDATENLSLAANWSYFGKRRFDNDQTNDFGQQIPAFDILDLKASQKWGNWQLSLSANNLLDEKAFDFGVRSTAVAGRFSAFPLPERNFLLTLGYDFN
ncbi:MAG: TonB-dependent receptor [Gammaproteobacteria bacterium]